jgi:hypothetical protein
LDISGTDISYIRFKVPRVCTIFRAEIHLTLVSSPRVCIYWIFWANRYHILVSSALGYAYFGYFGHTDIIHSFQAPKGMHILDILGKQISYTRFKRPTVCIYRIFWAYRYHTLVSSALGYAYIGYFGHTDIIHSFQAP